MQFKRVSPISDHPIAARKKSSYQNRTPAAIQKQTVQLFEASGLAQVEFCEQQNIHYKTFTNWLRRYSSSALNKLSGDDNSIIRSAQEKSAVTHVIFTLPNSLSISVNDVVLTDLTKLIEALSACKLN